MKPFPKLTSDLRIDTALQRGEVREALGWNFVRRLEKLADELLSKPDCPEVFWIIFTVKWDYINRKVKEFWQITDAKPLNQMLGQVVYEIHKSGKAEYCALPMDIPVPDSEYSDDFVQENIAISKNIPLSKEEFEKLW